MRIFDIFVKVKPILQAYLTSLSYKPILQAYLTSLSYKPNLQAYLSILSYKSIFVVNAAFLFFETSKLWALIMYIL